MNFQDCLMDMMNLNRFIDVETMKIHHQKHHQAYVDGLNKSLESDWWRITSSIHFIYTLSDLKSIPESGRSAINFFGGGFENHRLFWEVYDSKW